MFKTKSSQEILYILRLISVWPDPLDSIISKKTYKTGRGSWAQRPKRISKEKKLKKVKNQIL